MAKKERIILDKSLLEKATILTLLAKMKHQQWEFLEYCLEIPKINNFFKRLLKKDFFVPDDGRFILTAKGVKATQISHAQRRRFERIFCNFVLPNKKEG